MVDRHRGAPAPVPAPAIIEETEDREPALVKTKVLETKPMSTDEAILQMELLGHDFFVFTAEDTEGTNVLYRRRDGDYGLIESR
jgi:putative sigma-54 modulation protein